MKKLLLMLLLILPLAYAQEVVVLKEAQNNIELGDILEIKITLNNPYNSNQIYQIIEKIPQGTATIDPAYPDNIQVRDGIKLKTYRWNVNINPNKVGVISYKIKPENLGSYSILPTTIITSTDEQFFSNMLNFNVNCKSNNVCEEGENSLNCPQDCNKGVKDGVCESKLDNVCDPDCEEDPDCNKNFNIKDFLPLSIGIIVIILIILFVIRFMKPKNH